MFGHVAGLGDVPWVVAGDWNATPDQLWAPALAPRASGWLPDVGGRRPTCFPVKGAPTEKDFFLVSQCLRGAVANYKFLPVEVLLTHRAVRLTLSLAAFRELVRIFMKLRIIPHLEPDKANPQAGQAPWVKPLVEAQGARLAWDAWTKAAEGRLLSRAGVSQGEVLPYRGRGTAPVVRLRMPVPIATHRRHGEVHGKAKVWVAQANRYRELARAREEHRQHYGDLLVAAIAANPPRGRDATWAHRGQKIASGRATPWDIEA